MFRLFFAVVVVSLTSCVEGVREPASTTRLTASGTWDGAHAELFTAQTRSGRVSGEILWPSKIQGGPPPLVILVNGATRDGTTALAMSLAESSIATLRYSDRSAIDDEIVSASVSVLRRDPRVGRIVLLADEDDARAEALAAVNVDVHMVLPRGTTSSEVVGALARHAHEAPDRGPSK